MQRLGFVWWLGKTQQSGTEFTSLRLGIAVFPLKQSEGDVISECGNSAGYYEPADFIGTS